MEPANLECHSDKSSFVFFGITYPVGLLQGDLSAVRTAQRSPLLMKAMEKAGRMLIQKYFPWLFVAGCKVWHTSLRRLI